MHDRAAMERCQSLPPRKKQSLRPLRGTSLPPRGPECWQYMPYEAKIITLQTWLLDRRR